MWIVRPLAGDYSQFARQHSCFRPTAESGMFIPRRMQFFSYARLAAIVSVLLLAPGIKPAAAADGPALVVVVSVDQLAYDYLERFRKNFADDGVFALCERDG